MCKTQNPLIDSYPHTKIPSVHIQMIIESKHPLSSHQSEDLHLTLILLAYIYVVRKKEKMTDVVKMVVFRKF